MHGLYKFFATVILCLAVLPLSAQSLGGFKTRLAAPSSVSSATVTVSEQGNAAQAVRAGASKETALQVRGYRVCIFFDNDASSRAGAVAAKALFTDNFPDTPVYMVYDNPYFKVTAGNCLSAEEAIILKGHIIDIFPKAFVKNEDFSIAELLD